MECVGKQYAIIADPEGPGWTFAERVFEEVCKESTDFCLGKVNIKKFPDGEIKPVIETNVRRKECYFIHDSSKDPIRWFTELAFVNHTLKYASASQIIDVLPFLRFGRQDRKDESRSPISTKVVADIVGLHATRMMTVDMHNNASVGCYDWPCDNLASFPVVVDYLKDNYPEILENMVVVSTDTGGAERTKDLARHLGVSNVAFGFKSRPRGGGAVEELRILGDVSGKNVLINDDIISTGGTFILATERARAEGAKKVYGYATNILFEDSLNKIASVTDRLFRGDMIYHHPHPKVEIIPFAPIFGKAIYRHSAGLSISELFE